LGDKGAESPAPDGGSSLSKDMAMTHPFLARRAGFLAASLIL